MTDPPTDAPADTREITRRRLEDVATGLFADQGFAATTVDAIVEGAGVSKPAMYRHFASKKDLYLTLLRRYREELAAAALAEVAPGRPVSEVVEAMVDAWFAHVEAHPYTWRLLFRDTTGDPDIEAVHAELHRAQVAADVALLATVDPPLPADQLEPLGEVIRGSLAGLALWWLANPGTPRAVPAAAMVRVVRGIIDPRR